MNHLGRIFLSAGVTLGLSLASPAARAVPVTSDLVLQYDGSDITTDGGGNVLSWNNQGSLGSVGDALSNPINRPTLGTQNGQTTIAFPGGASGDLQSSTFSTALAQPNTMFMVLQDEDTNSPVIFDGVTSTQRNMIQIRAGGDFQFYAGSSRSGGSGHQNGRFELYAVTFNEASSRVDLYGNTVFAPISTIGTQPLGRLALGNSPPNSSSSSLALTGQMAEVLFYDRVVTSAEQSIIENYLSAKFNTGGTPVGTNNTLGANDRYAGDLDTNGDYDLSLVGIGNDGTTSLTSSTDDGFTLDELGGSLDSDEWVLAAHKIPVNSVLAAPDNRWQRVWYVDATKVDGIDAKLSFDFSEAGLTAPNLDSDLTLVSLLYSPTDPFNFTSLGISPMINGDTVSFDVLNGQLLDGYYTLGIQAVPEPSTGLLVGLGALWMHGRRRRPY